MSNQIITLKGKLIDNPVFVETVDGKRFAELNIEYSHTVSNAKGSEVRYVHRFSIIVKDDLIVRIQRGNKDNFVEVTGDYKRIVENNVTVDKVFANEIRISDKNGNLKAMELEVIGNLVAAPELKASLKGNQYFRIAVAADSKFRNQEGAEIKLTTFYNLLFVGDVAEANRELKKGSYVRVKGVYEIKPYKTKVGLDREDTTIFVKEIKAVEFNENDSIQPDELIKKTD